MKPGARITPPQEAITWNASGHTASGARYYALCAPTFVLAVRPYEQGNPRQHNDFAFKRTFGTAENRVALILGSSLVRGLFPEDLASSSPPCIRIAASSKV